MNLFRCFVVCVGNEFTLTKKDVQDRLKRNINGIFCSKSCSSEYKKKNNQDFIIKANRIHNNKYNYLDTYISSTNKITISCPLHGCFKQRPNDHLSGYGCPTCGILSRSSKQTKTKEQWIVDANNIHDYKYEYVDDYFSSFKPIKILCKLHGVFIQTPNAHLNGQGCPECANELKGWTFTQWNTASLKSKYFDGFKVYILYCCKDEESFIKIGRTFRTVKDRYKRDKDFIYQYEILKEFSFDNAKECCLFELELLKKFKNKKHSPTYSFSGETECFKKEIIHELDI